VLRVAFPAAASDLMAIVRRVVPGRGLRLLGRVRAPLVARRSGGAA
jgi:hypothetical protein